MADLKDLQEMAKNGKISKELLADEEFKNKLKKNLKEENGIEVTEEQVNEIIMNFENTLQNEKLLNKAQLENISGGLKGNDKGIVGQATAVKGLTAILGAVLAGVGGHEIGGKVGNSIWKNLPGDNFSVENVTKKGDVTTAEFKFKRPDKAIKTGKVLGTGVGAVGGFAGGWALGEYICKKFNIKNKD